MNDWIIQILDNPAQLTRRIYIFRKLSDNRIEMLGGEVLDSQGVVSKPTLELLPEALQAFADALNELGIRPQKGFLEGKLEGTEKHLEDMRKLVFKIK